MGERWGGDDALVLKSDYSVGTPRATFDHLYSNSIIGSVRASALRFGVSEGWLAGGSRFEASAVVDTLTTGPSTLATPRCCMGVSRLIAACLLELVLSCFDEVGFCAGAAFALACADEFRDGTKVPVTR